MVADWDCIVRKLVRVADGRVKPGHDGVGRRQPYIFFCCVRSQPTTSGLPLVFASSTLYFQLTFAKFSDRLSCGASSDPALTLYPLRPVSVNSYSRYDSTLSLVVDVNLIVTLALKSPPTASCHSFGDAFSIRFVTTTSLIDGSDPSRVSSEPCGEVTPRPTPHWNEFTWIQSLKPSVVTDPVISPYFM